MHIARQAHGIFDRFRGGVAAGRRVREVTDGIKSLKT